MAKVEAIMATSHVPGTSAKLEITGEFLPLVENADGKALFEHYAAMLKELGEPETDGAVHRRLRRFRLCRGDRHADHLRRRSRSAARAHSPDEYLEIETMVPRAQALALAMLRLALSAVADTAASHLCIRCSTQLGC